MKEFSYFLLQMTTPEDRMAAKSLELNLRGVETIDDFNEAIATFQQRFPERFDRPWMTSLLESLRHFCDMDDMDEYPNPLRAFLSKTVRTLNHGHPIWLHRTVQFDITTLTAAEQSAPHMQWCALLAQRYRTLIEAGTPIGDALRLCQIHPLDEISDAKATQLNTLYVNDDHMAYMSFADFINIYLKSRQQFAVEDQQLQPELAEKMTKTLQAWNQSGVDIDSHVDWLARNYNFHWAHRPFLQAFVTQALEGAALASSV